VGVFLRCFCLIFLIILGTGLPAYADDPTFEQLRVDLLTGQAAVANRAGKSVCFLLLGADRGLQEVAAIAAIDAFERDILSLRDGDEDRGLPPESNAEAAILLTNLAKVSRPVTRSARQIVAGDLHRVPMRLFVDGLPQIETQVNAVVSTSLGQHGADGTVGPTILAVQELGAIAQAALRDACFLRVGLLSSAGTVRLRDAIARFKTNMAALQNGDASRSIPATNDLKISVTLKKVARYWEKVAAVVQATLDADDVTVKDLQKASIMADLLEKSLDKVRTYYWAL